MAIKWVFLIAAFLKGMCEGLLCTDVQGLKCRKGTHSLCHYKYDSHVGACTEQTNASTQYVKDRLLGYHNYVRNQFAEGKVRSWPAAANMRQFTWDDDLADVALIWAYQCVRGHDACRITKEFEQGVGQNAGFKSHTESEQPVTFNVSEYSMDNYTWQTVPLHLARPHGTEVFALWLNEIVLTSANIVDKFQFDKEYGHFTVLVWANTFKLGCGMVDSKSGQFLRTQLVCNYGPAGNIVDFPMYLRGDGCSKCESGTKCNPQSSYPKLCALPGDPADEVPVPIPIVAVTIFPSHILLPFLTTTSIFNAT